MAVFKTTVDLDLGLNNLLVSSGGFPGLNFTSNKVNVGDIDGNDFGLLLRAWDGNASIDIGDGEINVVTQEWNHHYAFNDGNPFIALGSSATNDLKINAVYNSLTQELDKIEFRTVSTGAATDDGRFEFYLDGTQKFKITDSFIEAWNVNLNLWGGKKVIFDGDGDAFAYILHDSANIAGKGLAEFIIATASTDNDVHFVDGETLSYVSAVADAFVTDGGTASQFVKGDGTLDSTTYITSASIEDWIRADVPDTKTSGNLVFNDNIRLDFGTGSDMQIRHDSVNNFINLIGGNLLIQDNATTRTTFTRSSGQWSFASDINAAYATTNLSEFEDANDTLIVKNVDNAISNGYTSIYMEHLGLSGRGTGRFNMINLSAGKSAFTWQLRDDAHTTDMREKMRLEGDGNLDLIDGNLVVADGYGLQSSSLSAVGVFIPASDGIDITAFDDTVFYNWGGSSYDEILRLDAGARVGIMTGNFRPDADSTRNLGSSSIRWSSVYADVFRSLTNVATSKTEGAAVFDGGTGAIVLDDQGQKRISWNDGGGNFTIRSGHYYNNTDERVVVAGDGAALINFNSDGADGYIDMKVGVTQTLADDPVVWATNGHIFRAQTNGISFFGTTFEGTASMMVHEITGRNGLYVNVPDGNSTSLRLGRADVSSWWNVNHAGNDFRLWNTGGSGQDVLIGVNSGGADQSNNLSVGTTSVTYRINSGGDIWLPNNFYLRSQNSSSANTRIHGINSSNLEYIGSVDATVDGTIIGNNTSYVQFNLGNVNHGKFTSSGTSTTLDVGRPDDQQGILALNGLGAAEGTSGGQVWFRLAADHDTTIDRFQIVASADDWLFGANTDTDLFGYYGDSDSWEFRNSGGVLIGVGESAPACRFHVVDEDNLLGGTTGNSQEFRRLQFRGGSGGNDVKIQEYAVRDATGTTWTTLRYHNSIGVDASYGTPGTDTRSFWERDPNTGSHYFGDQADTILTIDGSNNRVGIGTTSPDVKLDVENTKNNAIVRTTCSTDDTSWVDGDIYGSFEMYSLDASNGGAGLVGYVRAVNESTTTGNRSDLVFGNRDASSMVAEKMRIDYLGNIRFGTTASPTTLSFAPNGGTDPYISYVDGTGFVISNQTADSFVIQDAATEIFRVNNNGDVTADGEFIGYDRTRKNITDDATTTHTVAAADAGICRRFTSSSSITVTVDTGSLTNIGDTAEIDQYGTGLVTIAAGTATLRVNGNATLVSSGQYSRISIQKMTSTEYRVFGELEPA